ncbi:HAMP domain-containing sensor histidine kinase [Anaerosolibacter sp.]|uniref:HAMP domain-containing sensor histidine kinase n=1 Tax=Anaerosolibacter sp. TaxID=1872527 RepID=UPI0039F0CB7B
MEGNMMKNPEIKGLLLRFTVVLMIILVLGGSIFFNLWDRFNRELIEKNSGIMGKLISTHPELKEEIVTAFVNESTTNEVTAGLEAARKYGYTVEMPTQITPVAQKFYGRFLGWGIGGIFMGFLLFFGTSLVFIRGTYKKIRLLSEGAEKIVEGDFTSRLPELDEGAFAKLAHQFNQMSKVLEGNLERLKMEKIFLKNITSDISHQLKTPLASLKMFHELMLDEGMDQDTQRQFLLKGEQQLERMEWLIKSLLKMARIEAGAIEFRKEEASMLKTIEDGVEHLRPRAEAKGQFLEIENSDEDILFVHDPNWVAEAISNMVKNAIDHTGYGGKIEIGISETPIMVRVTIADNGEGIAEEDLPHIFERFYKGKNNIHGSGTGIGLALAKVIIENHQGRIAVKSKPGGGTTFTITFLKGII